MIENGPVLGHEEIDSTSEEAKRLARRGEISTTWIAANRQSSGKGRLGRTWVSPEGNLYCTVLFPEPGGLAVAARIPFAAALAVYDVCEVLCPDADAKLKWPNDVRVSGRKISGILTESGETNGVMWIALGIGVNVRHAPQGVGQDTTSLIEQGAPTSLLPADVLAILRTKLSRRVRQARTDFESLLADWLLRAEGRGELVRAGPENARIEGVFEGLAEDGGLVLRLREGARHTIRAGDVDLVRQVT